MNGTDHLVDVSTGGCKMLKLNCPVRDTTDKSLPPGLYQNIYQLIQTTYMAH
jgi:hypothetical protein